MFGVGNAIATALRLWARHLPRWLVLSIVFHLLLVGWQALHWHDSTKRFLEEYYYRPQFEAHPILRGTVPSGAWIVAVLVTAAIAIAVVGRLRGERVGLGRTLRTTLRRAPALFVAGLVVRAMTTGLPVVFVLLVWDREGWYARGEGTYLVWAAMWTLLTTLFVAVVPALVVEERGPLSAVARGWRLVRGNRIKVFAVLLVAEALYYGIYLLANTLLLPSPYIDFEAYRERVVIYGYVVFGLEIVLSSLWAVTIAVIYERLREAKEGPAPSQLDRVFD